MWILSWDQGPEPQAPFPMQVLCLLVLLRRYLHGLCHFLCNQQKQTIFSRSLIAVKFKYSMFFGGHAYVVWK